MRKRIWLVVLFLAGVLVVTLGATSVFAQEPVVSDGEALGAMHQACANGDYGAMAELHAQYHGGEGGMMGSDMTDNVTAEMMNGCGGSDGMMNGGMMGGDMMGGGMTGNGMMGGGMTGNGMMGGGATGNGMMGGGMMGN